MVSRLDLLLAEKARRAAAMPKRKIGTVTEDIEDLGRGSDKFIRNLPENVGKTIEGIGEHPKQAFAGIIPGLASLGDTPAFLYNAVNKVAEYPLEKITGIESPDVGLLPKRLPYKFQEMGSQLADKFAGMPQTESQQYARLGGELPASFLNPSNLLKTTGKQIGKGITHTGNAIAGFDPNKYEALKNVGVSPHLSEVSKHDNIARGVGHGLENAPFAANRMQLAQAEREKEVNNIFNKVAELNEAKGAELAGREIRKGGKAYNKKATQIGRDLYDRAWKDIDRKQTVPLPNTIKEINIALDALEPEARKILEESRVGQELLKIKNSALKEVDAIKANPEYKAKLDKLGQENPIQFSLFEKKPPKNIKFVQPREGIPFGDLEKVYKSDLDDLIKSWGQVGDSGHGVLKNISNTMKKEMDSFVLKQKPEAARSLEVANKYWSQYSDRNKNIANRASKESNTSNSFNGYLSALRSGDIQKANLLTQRLSKLDHKIVSTSAINELGRMEDGAFNPEKFIDRFSNMRPESQDALLSGFDKAQAKQVKEIVAALKNAQYLQKSGKGAGTAYIGSFLTHLSTIPIALGTGSAAPILASVGTGLATRGLAEIFTNPKITKAMYDVSKAHNPIQLEKLLAKHTILPRLELLREEKEKQRRQRLKGLLEEKFRRQSINTTEKSPSLSQNNSVKSDESDFMESLGHGGEANYNKDIDLFNNLGTQ